MKKLSKRTISVLVGAGLIASVVTIAIVLGFNFSPPSSDPVAVEEPAQTTSIETMTEQPTNPEVTDEAPVEAAPPVVETEEPQLTEQEIADNLAQQEDAAAVAEEFGYENEADLPEDESQEQTFEDLVSASPVDPYADEMQ